MREHIKKHNNNLKQATILIVDDSTISRKKLKQDLNKENFLNILEANSAEEALELIKIHTPDIFLIDMLMPGITGNELSQKLRDTNKFKTTPIIIVTASDEEKLIQESFHIGANDFLRKPWNSAELTARVTSQLERHQAIIALKESTLRFEQAMEISVDGIWEYNLNNNNIYISPACHKILCLDEKKNNFSIEFFIDLLHEDDRSRTVNLIKKALNHNRDLFEFECRINLNNSVPRWISTSAKVVEHNENRSPKRIIGISKNITSQIIAQKHLERYGKDMRELADERAQIIIHHERLAAIGTMSAGIAHEINNPLSYITGNIQLLQKVIPIISEIIKENNNQLKIPDNFIQVSKNIIEIVNALEEGTNRVKEIIKSMKNFSRKESDTNTFITEDISLPIEDALVLCQGALKKGITVIKKYHKNEYFLPMHKQQITQVLINLINNAAQAMNYHGKLIISTSQQNNNFIKIAISDTGPGIPEDIISKVFNPFFTTKKENEGTGIGLSISKTIINDHNGILRAQNSIETGGAEFSILLPQNINKTNKEINSKKHKNKVILAEDNEIMQEIIMQRLLMCDCKVTCTTTENETIKLLKKELPDVLIISMSKSKTIGILSLIDKLIETELFPCLYVINDINSINLTKDALKRHIGKSRFPTLKVVTTQDIHKIIKEKMLASRILRPE